MYGLSANGLWYHMDPMREQ